jgi:hypothetical protein
MKQFSVSVKAVAFAVTMATASMSHAATTDLGTIGPGYSEYFSIERLGVFEDFYTFSLLGSANIDVKRTITFTMDDALNEFRSGFNNLTRGLYDADTNTELSWSSYVEHGQTYFYTNLDAGDYYFRVAGEAWKAADFVPNPRYNALVNISAAPVPEPETYAMLLAGLGILGTVVRRRSNKL